MPRKLDHAMGTAKNSMKPRGSFLRSALALAACVLVVALALLPFAVGKSGTGGPGGLALAAAICLAAGWGAELVAWHVNPISNPLAGMLLGMGIRMFLPLAICVGLALQRANGRHHLPFVCYLLAFYMATLVVETLFAVSRATQSAERKIPA